MRLYSEAYLYETVRVIRYDGIKFQEIQARLKPLVSQFGQARIDNALFTLTLTTFDLLKPPESVTLKPYVAKISWQLLGPLEGHPEFNRIRSNQPWVPT